MILEVEGLNKTYPGGVQALVDVGFRAGPGIFGLLGPNGAGKSTLMRTIATLQAPDSGRVLLAGRDFLADPLQSRRRCGYLPQDIGVYPRVSAREMLLYLAGLSGIPRSLQRAQVGDLLARVNLTAAADQRLDTYSGGMRQRFGIAVAFLSDPELLVIDEPTSGLDPLERRYFQQMLAELAADRVLILSSHIVEDIASLCGRMALMDHGRILVDGDPRDLVATLAGAVWSREVERREVGDWHERVRVLSCRPVRRRYLLRVHADESPGEGFTPVVPDLEDYYAFRIGGAA